MANLIHSLACVDPQAELGDNIEIGPFCVIGPHVKLGNGCQLANNVTVLGHATIGERNRFFSNCVIGGEPQDHSYQESATWLEIGDDNVFREGVTVNRGAEKEDHGTRIGSHNMLMSNAHVAHNCYVGNHVMLVNGVLLGGHVHVHDRAIVSGNTVVHHFCSIGTLAFISGGCRCVVDVAPYMMATGSDNFEVKTINLVGMRRAGVSESSIAIIRQAYKQLFREHKGIADVREFFAQQQDDIHSIELHTLLNFMDMTNAGKFSRGREVFRNAPSINTREQRKAA
ncbi:MAG: acyl-ACP--UDP-N-acetylglucosamine O-acyltransferase [Planctomycetota bacterium]|nr:MAG: acyl-ACP--UDP-N-acetylglucosamine O-acyltransferase [Planctomycetota bacterium]GDY09801.1 acyl-[acyl-carrier-protein]--UDP-N-acetylglucosamine O-acyltransferase [Planctomycetia bacterium]